ncbi:MAG: hypothetical protein RIM99_18315 [Cyclobacteriaceae bacterium]
MKNCILLTLLITSCTVSQKTNAINPFSGDQVGCGNFIVYKLSEDGTQYISVALNAGSIELERSQTYNIQNSNDLLEVTWRQFEGDVSSSLCNDLRTKRPEESINLVSGSGTVNVRLSEEELEKARKGEAYKATLTLRKIVFEGLTVDYLQIENITVGWLPG